VIKNITIELTQKHLIYIFSNKKISQ